MTDELLSRQEFLEPDEIEIVATPKSRLRSSHVNAVLTLLQLQFPEIRGLMGVEYCDFAVFQVYDSMRFEPDHRELAIACLSILERCKDKSMSYDIVPCQRQQSGGNDCGVLTISFAVNLAFGLDPIQQLYDAKDCRIHLKRCLLAKKIEILPYTEKRAVIRKNTRFEVDKFCKCRRVDFKEARHRGGSR